MDDKLKIANKLVEIIVGNLTCVENWSPYIFDDDFSKEVALRNKAGVIWLCAMLDTVESEIKVVDGVLKVAGKYKLLSLVHNTNQLRQFCRLTGDLLELFSREEQIFLVDLRNQWVHGYLSGRHVDIMTVKFYKGGVVVREKVTRLEYAGIMEEFYSKGLIDETLQDIIVRALDKNHGYWQSIRKFQSAREEIYRCLRDDECCDLSFSK